MSKRIHTADDEDDGLSEPEYETITLQEKGRPKGSKDLGKRKMTEAKWNALKKAQEALKKKREANKKVEAPAFNRTPPAYSGTEGSRPIPKKEPKVIEEVIEEEPEVIRKIIRKKKKIIEEVVESDSDSVEIVRRPKQKKPQEPRPASINNANREALEDRHANPQPKQLNALDYLLASYGGYNPF